MAEANLDPVFQIQRVYLKDMSLEQPNSPEILLNQEQPGVDIQLGVEAAPVADGLFEVTVTATVHAKIADKPCFWSKPSKPVFLSCAICRKSNWALFWASPARKLCTPTCAVMWPTWCSVAVFRLCIWLKSTFRRCTSSSRWTPLRHRLQRLKSSFDDRLLGFVIARS